MFHVRHLHIGHLAKAFALREAPSAIAQKKGNKSLPAHRVYAKAVSATVIPKARRKTDDLGIEHDNSAEKRMQEIVRKQGRLVKKAGILMASGTDDFQIAGGYDLEKLLSQAG